MCCAACGAVLCCAVLLAVRPASAEQARQLPVVASTVGVVSTLNPVVLRQMLIMAGRSCNTSVQPPMPQAYRR